MDQDEKNPLQVNPISSPAAKDRVINKRGRPTMGSIIKFGPQPKSIIAQMLTEMKTETNEPISIDEDEFIRPSGQDEELTVADIIEEHVYTICAHRSNDIKEHKKHHTKHQQFICDYPNCSYSCKLSSNLIKHKRVHTNEKPYLCDRCSFRSNFINSLKVHKRTHTAEKPYHCKQCSYKCNSSSNLKKHCHIRHPESSKCKYNDLMV